MTLLTRIHNLKSKYSETAGLMIDEGRTFSKLQSKRQSAFKDWEGKSNIYKEKKGAFETLTGEFTGLVKGFRETYGPSLSEDTPLDQYGDSFYKANFEKFSQTEGYQDWAIYMSAIERTQNKPSGFNTGLMLQKYAERAKQGIADFKRLVADPMEKLGTDFKNIGSFEPRLETAEGEVETAFKEQKTYADTLSSFDDQLESSMKRMRSYGVSQSQIQSRIQEAQYGMEKRKRGTRGSAFRTTTLTSRSPYRF
tara:strand:+ start:995 stop:1750 length:756 start_codon:yes stop_codon:yes gene_type:complete